MDGKEATLIRNTWLKIMKSTQSPIPPGVAFPGPDVYDEWDIHSLLMLLREYADDGSPLKELSHFIAHRRRNRGDFFNYVAPALKTLHIAATTGAATTELQVDYVYTEEELLSSIGSPFHRTDFKQVAGTMPLPEAALRGMAFCMMSLLQGVDFVEPTSGVTGKMLLQLDREVIELVAWVTLERTVGPIHGPITFILSILAISNPGVTIRPSPSSGTILLGSGKVGVASVDRGRFAIRVSKAPA